MSYYIQAVESKGRVWLTFERTLSPGEITASLQEVGSLLASGQWRSLLVDVTALQALPTAEDLFTLSEALPRSVSWSIPIALVVRPEQVRVARLIEHVIRARGARLTFFTEAEKATENQVHPLCKPE